MFMLEGEAVASVQKLQDASSAEISKAVDRDGFATLPGLLKPDQCHSIAELYEQDALFRSQVHMARHGFGKGEYKYFAFPLPDIVGELRRSIYPPLVDLANEWNERMGVGRRYPAYHDVFVEECRRSGQSRPTPLLLRYGSGDYNCLHQDLYGDIWFPIQVAILLSEPGRDFTGGEFVLTEQRPRMQSRVRVVGLRQGDGVAFAVQQRPVTGSRGHYRVNMRHGVSQVLSGERFALGIIFHEAR